jgi:hypothetical protein
MPSANPPHYPGAWDDVALGRKAVRLGLCTLESDGLILVESRSSRPAVITLLPGEGSPSGRFKPEAASG